MAERQRTTTHMRFTEEQVAQALRGSKGFVNIAAQKLDTTSSTIRAYISRSPRLQEIQRDERGLLLDEAEAGLWKAIRAGDAWAITFALRTLGKDRGYVERQEHTGAGGGPIDLQAIRRLSDEELHRIAAGGEPPPALLPPPPEEAP